MNEITQDIKDAALSFLIDLSFLAPMVAYMIYMVLQITFWDIRDKRKAKKKKVNE